VTVIAFSVVYPLYFLSYNALCYAPYRHNGWDTAINFAFWAVKPSTFMLTWEALRYYNLAIYSMAFFLENIHRRLSVSPGTGRSHSKRKPRFNTFT
jgi:hypothetical protein